MYYAEIRKRQGDIEKYLSIEKQLHEFIQNNADIVHHRNLDFGIADVEYYALRVNKEKSLALLKSAVHEQGWLPNAFWLWSPIAANPFLEALKNEPIFQEIASEVHSKYPELNLSQASIK